VVVGEPFIYQPDEDAKEFCQRVYNWFLEQKE